MEILTPAPPEESREQIWTEEEGGLPPLRQVEMLAHLELKDEMFNPNVMEKVSFLSENMDVEGLEELSLRVGGFGVEKLNNVYSYVKLSLSEAGLESKLRLIKEAKCQMQHQSQI